jgi:type II secretory pathway component PulF
MRRAGELRRTFIAAMIYPLVVLTIAGSLFSFTVTKVSPVIVQTYVAMNAPRPDWYGYALAVAQHVPRATACALVLIGFLAVWWLCRSPWSVAWSAGRFGGFSLTGVLQAGRLATFAELMALMVEQQVPMAEAVELSTAASGDARLRQSGKALADRIRQGDTKAAIPPGMPPLLSWLLVVGMRQDQLIRSLRRYAAAYRRKAMYWGDWMSTYLPILLSAVFGGSVVLAYALLVMAPVYNLLFQLSGR